MGKPVRDPKNDLKNDFREGPQRGLQSNSYQDRPAPLRYAKEPLNAGSQHSTPSVLQERLPDTSSPASERPVRQDELPRRCLEPGAQLYLRESGLAESMTRLFVLGLGVEREFRRARKNLDREQIAWLLLLSTGRLSSPAELARLLGISRQTAGRKAEALAKRGWVIIVPHGADGRRLRVQVTDAGRRLIFQGFGNERKRMAQIFSHATPESVAGFLQVLGLLSRH